MMQNYNAFVIYRLLIILIVRKLKVMIRICLWKIIWVIFGTLSSAPTKNNVLPYYLLSSHDKPSVLYSVWICSCCGCVVDSKLVTGHLQRD